MFILICNFLCQNFKKEKEWEKGREKRREANFWEGMFQEMRKEMRKEGREGGTRKTSLRWTRRTEVEIKKSCDFEKQRFIKETNSKCAWIYLILLFYVILNVFPKFSYKGNSILGIDMLLSKT